jgi:DNA replication protein DnaC
MNKNPNNNTITRKEYFAMNTDYKPDDICRFLSEMRLASLAETFKDSYQKAVADELGILQFLGGFLEGELLGRNNRRFERLINAANLDPADSIENYDFELARAHGVEPAQVRDLAAGSYIGPTPRNIVLAGSVGAGKTKLARTLAFEAVRRNYKAVVENTRDMIERLYRMRDSHLFPKLYRRFVAVDVLVLDDLAYMPFAPEQVEFLFRIVFDRIEKQTGPVIVTTNTDVKEWWQFFPSKAMGMAFSDRILGGAVGIKFSGPSIRAQRTKTSNPANPPDPDERK